MFRHLEKFILRVQENVGIRYFHTIIIAVLLGFNGITIGLVILLAKSSISLPGVVLQFLEFLFIVIFLGIILGITSNYVYDQVLATMSDPNRIAISESKLINYFLPEKESEKRRRTDLTVERINNLRGEVCLLGIAATSYLPKRDDDTIISEPFINKLLSHEISLRLILLNPYSQAGKFRYAREEGIDIDTVGERQATKDQFESSAFYNDISRTMDKIRELRDKGAIIECRLTNFEPTISMMCTDSFVYIDILSLGRIEEATKYTKQRITFPILEFSPDSQYYQVAKSHFEYHWKYSITPDEFDYHRPVMEERFYSPSFTGYRLVKQHESWISIDPIIGCNIGCRYCVLETTFRNDTKPRIYTSPELVGNLLRESKFYHDEAILCLFNYTDALIKENREHLIESLENLKEKNFRNWICIPTKVAFDRDFANRVAESYYKDKIIFLLSLSGLPRQYEPKVKPEELIVTMKMLKEIGIPVIHYWRPVTSLNCNDKHIKNMLDQVSDYAKCSVVVGLKASQALNKYYLREGLVSIDQQKDHGDYLPEGFMSKIKDVLDKSHKTYSVYLHASCAVSKITHQPDYNGTMFRESICSLHNRGASICHAEQEKVCGLFKKNVEQDFDKQRYLETIKRFLPAVDVRAADHRIELMNPVFQEDFICLIHRIKYPIEAKNILYTNQYVGSILG